MTPKINRMKQRLTCFLSINNIIIRCVTSSNYWFEEVGGQTTKDRQDVKTTLLCSSVPLYICLVLKCFFGV